MTIAVMSIKHKKGVVEGRSYDNYEVMGLVPKDLDDVLVCGSDYKVAKFAAPVFKEALKRNIKALNNPDIRDIEDLYGLLMSVVVGEYGLVKGKCEDFTLAVPSDKK